MSCTSSLLYAVQHPTLLCVIISLHTLIWCDWVAARIFSVCFLSHVCSYRSSSLCIILSGHTGPQQGR